MGDRRAARTAQCILDAKQWKLYWKRKETEAGGMLYAITDSWNNRTVGTMIPTSRLREIPSGLLGRSALVQIASRGLGERSDHESTCRSRTGSASKIERETIERNGRREIVAGDLFGDR